MVPPTLVPDAVVEGLGAVFFFCAEMVIFICVLNQIAGEKEQRLKIAMEMAGMKVIKKEFLFSYFSLSLFILFMYSLFLIGWAIFFQIFLS